MKTRDEIILIDAEMDGQRFAHIYGGTPVFKPDWIAVAVWFCIAAIGAAVLINWLWPIP